MQVKTILKNCHKFKIFVYGRIRFISKGAKTVVEAEIFPCKNSKTLCSDFGCPESLYDKLGIQGFSAVLLRD